MNMATIMDTSALKVKTAPAFFVALMIAAQDHGEKEGYTSEWPRLTLTPESSSLPLSPSSTLCIGLVTFTCKHQIFDSLGKGITDTRKRTA